MTQEGNHGDVGLECNKFMEQEVHTPLMRSVGNRVETETPTNIDYYLKTVARNGVWVQGSHTALETIFCSHHLKPYTTAHHRTPPYTTVHL
jgi:hypothetical protein